MKAVSISGSLRANVGKRSSKDIRNDGGIPCVLYGGKEQIHFFAPYNSFKPLVYSPEVHTVELNIEGTKYNAILQDIQLHTVNDKILHIDFLQLDENKPVIFDIPVKVQGTSIGVRQGGKLLTNVRALKIKALPKHLPDNISINVENLNIGQDVRVKDLSLEGVQFLDTPNAVIVSVRITRNVVAAEGAAPAAGAAKAAPAPAAAKAAPAKK